MSAQQIAALRERAKANKNSLTPTKTPVEHRDSHMFSMCICNRQLQDILCRSCGYIFVGRQRRQCMLHPNEIHLMDATVCPKCRTNSLIEIKTSGTPVKKHQDELMTELTHLRQRRLSKGEKSGFGGKMVSTGCATEEDDWEKEADSSFSPTTTYTRHIADPAKASSNLHSPLNLNSGLKYDSLKSSNSKMGGFSSTYYNVKSPESNCFDSSLNYNDLSGPESIIDNTSIQVPYGIEAPVQNTKPETRFQEEPKKGTETERKLVNTEVQTEFVIQVLETPNFCKQTAFPPVQHLKGNQMTVGYKYEPKRPVGGDKENSVLRAAIKRSNSEGWNKGLDRMNDLCIGDRRF